MGDLQYTISQALIETSQEQEEQEEQEWARSLKQRRVLSRSGPQPRGRGGGPEGVVEGPEGVVEGPDEGVVEGFPLNASFLRANAHRLRVRVCE